MAAGADVDGGAVFCYDQPGARSAFLEHHMKILRCKDFGVDCPKVFRGKTFEDVLQQAKTHGIEAHGQTEAQVNSEETRAIAARHTKDE